VHHIPNDRHTPHGWLVIAVLVGLWAALTIQLNAPWFGHHDANGAWISAAVRNNERYGLAWTRLIPVTNYAPVPNVEELRYYTHHPPLIVWLSGLSAEVIGLREMTLRWTVACLTLLSAAGFFALARRLIGPQRAVLALALYALTPMILYFGRMPNHEPLALMIGLLFANVLYDWLHQPTPARWAALAIMSTASAWSMWGGVMLIGMLGAMAFVWHLRRVQWRCALYVVGLGVIAVIAIAGLLAYYEWGAPGAFERLIAAFGMRTSDTLGYEAPVGFTVGEFISRQIADLVLNLTPGIVFFSIVGFWFLQRERAITRWVVATLWLMPLVYILLLRNAAQEHDFYKIFFVPSVALLSAVAVDALWRRPRWRPLVVGLLLVIPLWNIVYVGGLHQLPHQPRINTIRQTLEALNHTRDLILSNVDGISVALLYYLDVPMQAQVTPEAVVTMPRPLWYVYCPAASSAQSDEPLPDILDTFFVQQDKYCAYFYLS
jgi:4-amino-4-deoxy-L-arabinose transferase-like glycosyltransferase